MLYANDDGIMKYCVKSDHGIIGKWTEKEQNNINKNSSMEKSKLIKVSTYARQEGISVPAVYKRIKAGSVECVEIDGVKFINVNNNGKH